MRKVRELILRLGGLFNKQRKDRDFDQEMESHLQMHIEDNLRLGMTPQEARRQAMIKLGGIESTKEAYRDQRGLPVLETLWKNIWYGARMLRKNPGFTLVAIGSLAIGLALSASTLAVVNAYLLRSLPYPTAHRVYHLRYAPPGPYEPRGMTSIDWKSLSDVVEDSITSSGAPFHLMDDDGLRRVRGLQASSGFIRGLGVEPVIGRFFVEEEFQRGAEAVAMISHEMWRNRFGSDPQILSRPLQVMRGEEAEQPQLLRIVGVLPAGFWYGTDSSAKVDILTPLNFVVRTYMVRLREGVPVGLAEKRITEAARSVGSDFRPDWTGVHLEPVHQRYVANIRPVLVGITIAVGVVLVLVCANLAVLLLLRAMRRQKELAVRVALGAERKHILGLVAAEVGLICGAALALGLALTGTALRVLTPLLEAQLGKPAPGGPGTIQIDPTVFAELGGLTLFIALALAFIPLLAPWGGRIADALRSQGTSSTDGPFMRRLRSTLIAAEVAGSLVLLVGGGLMIRSAVNLMRTDLGFNPKQVLRVGIRLPARTHTNAPALYQFFVGLNERLPKDPNSQVALMTAFPPFYPANTQRFEAAEAEQDQTLVGMLRVGANYFGVYDVPLKQGREFTSGDRPGSEPVAVISQTLARSLWPNGSAIGRQIRVVEGDMPESPLAPWRTIVGVVGDIRQGYADSDLRDIYLPFLQVPSRFASIHVRTVQPLSFWEKNIRAAARELNPYAIVSPATTIVSEDRQRAGTRFLTLVLTGFSGFAAFLAVLGIYGVTKYAVQQREREIAIRAALGGSRGAIMRLFLKQGGRVLAIGLGLGLCGALAAAKILRSQVHGVQPFDLATFAIACALMSAAGLFAVWWPARRAARIDPMVALRSE